MICVNIVTWKGSSEISDELGGRNIQNNLLYFAAGVLIKQTELC